MKAGYRVRVRNSGEPRLDGRVGQILRSGLPDYDWFVALDPMPGDGNELGEQGPLGFSTQELEPE